MNLISTLSIISTVALAIYSAYNFNRFNQYKWIVIYCFINATVEIVAFIFALRGIHNFLLYYVLIFTEIFAITLFFYSASAFITKVRKVYFFIFIYSILCLLLFKFESFTHFSPYSGIFEGFVIFIFCLLHLANEIKNPKVSNIVKVPVFWFVSAFLIYYGCSWLILLGTQLFTFKQELFIYIWDGQNILNIIKNILITIGILWIR